MQITVLYLRTDPVVQKVVAGGSVAHTLGVIQGFKDHGVRVICGVGCMSEEIAALSVDKIKKLTVPRLISRVWWRLICLLSNLLFLPQLWLLCKNEKITFIYQRYTLFNCIGVFMSILKKVPLVLEYNGSEVWIDIHWGSGRSWKKGAWLSGLIESLNLRYAQTIVVVSQALCDELVERGIEKSKILVNPNGVNVDEFDPEKLIHVRKSVRRELSLNDRYVFGFVGTFSLWHGINVLADMIPRVVKRDERAHFLLIGDGPLCSFLKEALLKANITAHNVTFTGMIKQREAKKYLAACDAFLSPTQPNRDGSRFFGSPTKMFEYMSMAKPVIASDLEQLGTIIQPALKCDYRMHEGIVLEVKNEQGCLVDYNDYDGFVGAARSLLKTPASNLEMMGMNARRTVSAFYTWKAHTARILKFLAR